MRSTHRLATLLAPLGLAGTAAAQYTGIPVFSVDYRSSSVSLPNSFTGQPITEGDLLAPQALVPLFGPLPLVGIVETGGTTAPVGLGLALHTGCIGHLPFSPCGVEVDALSHGLDAMQHCNWTPLSGPPRWVFSVHSRAIGDALSGTPPTVNSESVCADEPADVYVDQGVFCGPWPIQVGAPGHTMYFDGNGLANCTGTGLFPGVGLQESLPPTADDLDALDADVPDPWLPQTTCTYFSLDSAFVDPQFTTPNTGSAAAAGFRGGDVLVSCPGCAPALYASALQLGLDLGGPDTDDLDALVLRENGVAGYQRSVNPYDWLSGQTDMLFFSVRRGSLLIGTPDALLGLPIEQGDILVPTGPLGTVPGIWMPAENLGLVTTRSLPGVIGDDVDALDSLQDPEPGSRFCPGDGSGTLCPCGNNGMPGRGCGNSQNALGPLLWANGLASISNDTVHFTASGMTANTQAQLFQGTGIINAGNGAVFGDGLRCVGGNVIRLMTRPARCGNREFGAFVPGDPLISAQGLITTPQVMHYQVRYRDNSLTFCTPAVFNLTNAYRIAWGP